MTLTDTLDHLLSVFLRPLRSWIEREFVAPWKAAYDAAMQTKEQYRDGVYLHLRERLEGTDEHPLAEGVPVRPLPATQDLAHLQEAVELLGERKIEWRGSTAVKDGYTLPRMICDSSISNAITEIVDDNFGWNYTQSFPFNLFPNLTKLTLGVKDINLVTLLRLNSTITEINLPYLETVANNHNFFFINGCSGIRRIYLPSFKTHSSNNGACLIQDCANLEEFIAPISEESTLYVNINLIIGCPKLRKVVLNKVNYYNSTTDCIFGQAGYHPNTTDYLMHIEIGVGGDLHNNNLSFCQWSPTNALRTDTTASDYIDLREDKDEQGEFINATNLEQFLANFRKYIIIRLANRTGQTALTLTLSAAVYQAIYGLDSSNNADNNSWARTHTLADLGLTADDLTEAETAAVITINTIYATWLDTYRSAINWNIGH